MIEWACLVAFAAIGAALLMNFWRLARGPTAADRIFALDTMVINVIALIMTYGIYRQTLMQFEAALLFAMVGFISTVAYCKFILRGDIIE
jgi:multicomponent K+:H+ antiporter subunit F